LISLGHTRLGSFFFDREDIEKLSIGAIRNFANTIQINSTVKLLIMALK
jgi:hypothetical protein